MGNEFLTVENGYGRLRNSVYACYPISYTYGHCYPQLVLMLPILSVILLPSCDFPKTKDNFNEVLCAIPIFYLSSFGLTLVAKCSGVRPFVVAELRNIP